LPLLKFQPSYIIRKKKKHFYNYEAQPGSHITRITETDLFTLQTVLLCFVMPRIETKVSNGWREWQIL